MNIKVPYLAEGVDSGTVVSILVKEGDRVKKDETVVELETKKAVAPIPSPAAGTILKIHVRVGEEVSVGQTLMTLAEEGKPTSAKSSPATQKENKLPKEESVPETRRSQREDAFEEGTGSRKVGLVPAAAPTIKKLARELGIDLRKVKGSERGGRIVMKDLRTYIEHLERTPQAAPSPETRKFAGVPIDFAKWGQIERKPMSQLRRAISEKMAESWATIPHVTQYDEADITEIMKLRKKYSSGYEKREAHLTLTSFVLKALVPVMKKFPIFNSSIDEASREIVMKNYYHIGVAVDTEAGLIVPILRDVDKKSMFEISKELVVLARKARERKVSLDELQGGTFTVTNLGSLGGSWFAPIINKPDVAILGLAKGILKPVLREGKAENRLMLPLCLSYDHRVIDGADGVRFIRALAQELEGFRESELKLKDVERSHGFRKVRKK